MSKLQQIKKLIIRYQEGKCSREEVNQLRAWFRDPENQELLEKVYDSLPEIGDSKDLSLKKSAVYRQVMADERVRRSVHYSPVSPARTLRWKKTWAVAAAVFLIAMVPFLYYTSPFFDTTENSATEDLRQHAIVPGGERALIILEDGTEVDLEEIGDTLIVQEGYSIVKDGEGVYYQYDRVDAMATAHKYNTIVTPKGGQYQVMLPDGTRVWLNAESKLKYPVYFAEDIREVELEGEGYFEVAKQNAGGERIPFIVYSGTQKLEVLGTIFNLQAYGEEIITTLVEGKVRLGLDNREQEVTLEAHDQATLQVGEQRFDLKKVDPLYATAWKNGSFAFRKANIKEVMESVARWYDFDVEYRTTGEGSRFTGTISRFEQIDKLLQLIELTESVHFSIEGRRVIVKE